MSISSSKIVQDARSGMTSYAVDTPDRARMVRAGLLGGLAGAVTIWIYEAVVWVGVQHLMPLSGIPSNAKATDSNHFSVI